MKLDWALIVFTLMAVGTGLGCYLLFGPDVFLDSLESDLDLIGFVLPRLGAAMLIAGFVQALLPPGFFARMMGEESGVKGLAVATVAGAVTPGGPMTSFPIVTMMRDCGTGAPALVAYVTAWSTLGLQRVFLWEVPLMGVEFAALRFLVSLPLGVIAGLLMRFMPPPSPAYPDGSEG